MDVLEGKPLEVDIDKITPDPDQPRQHIDEEAIGELAQSIKTEGIINPIEIDSNYMIVTGERRWRAARLIGLKTVPCKIIEVAPENRFRRQVIENIHNNTMSPMDTSNALVKLLSWSPGDQHPKAPLTGPTADRGMRRLGEEIGKSHNWISGLIQLQGENEETKEYLSRKEAKYSIIREINRGAPEELKETFKQKVISEKPTLTDRETTNELLRAVKWAPDKAKELLSEDYSRNRSAQNIIKIHKIAPEHDTTDEGRKLGVGIVKHVMRLEELVEEIDVSKALPAEKTKMASSLRKLGNRLIALANELENTPLIGRVIS